MEIKFRKIKDIDEEYFRLIADWDNDEEIKYYIRPNFEEGELHNITPEEIKAGISSNDNKNTFIILSDEKRIGYISIDTDFKYLYNNDKNIRSSWIGICIGEKEFRSKGIGKICMEYLEKLSKELGVDRIELGVFSYNTGARTLYEKMGYTAIGEIEDFVHYRGTWHSDIRMEKII